MQNEATDRNLMAFSGADYIAGEKVFQEWQGPKFKKLIEIISGIHPRGRIADVGCFTGIGSQLLFDVDGVSEVHGFDASERALSVAERRGLVTGRWLAGLEDSPAGDNFYDVTVAMDIIEHLTNTRYFMRELVRITRQYGFIIISTPNLAYWHSRMRLLTGRPPHSFPGVSSDFRSDIAIDLNHIRINVPAEWSGFFESSGLRLIKREGYRIEGNLRGIKRSIDILMTKLPDYSYGNIFLLKKC